MNLPILIKNARLYGVVILSLFFLSSGKNIPDIDTILLKLFEQNKKIERIKLTISMKERIDNEFHKKKTDFKIVANPRKVYLKQKFPKEGMEVLYVDGLNNNRASVNTNSFPWKTLNLNPLGHFMRNGNHHSIFKSGFSFLMGVLEHLYGKYNGNWAEMTSYNGLVKYNEQLCHKITVDNPKFQVVDYIIQENENLEYLSHKLKVNDFMIYNLNDKLNSFDEVEAGINIKVPNDYARKFILYINKEKHILAGIKIFDNQGLYEEYAYSNIEINPTFAANEFDVENPKYGF